MSTQLGFLSSIVLIFHFVCISIHAGSLKDEPLAETPSFTQMGQPTGEHQAVVAMVQTWLEPLLSKIYVGV
jgi:hypothetical protein